MNYNDIISEYTYWEESKHPPTVNDQIRNYIATKLELECTQMAVSGAKPCLTKAKSPLSITKLVDVSGELAHIVCNYNCSDYECKEPAHDSDLCDICIKNMTEFICTCLPRYMQQYDDTYLSTRTMLVNRESTPYRELPYKLKDKITEDQFRLTANNTEIINLRTDNLVANCNIEILFTQLQALKPTSK